MIEQSLPKVMTNAKLDLASTVEGKFSPTDWEKILERAHAQLRQNLETADEESAWKGVIRDFHLQRFWGYRADYRAPRKPKPERKSLAFQFIWLLFASLTIMKVALVWFGQIYTNSDEPHSGWMFFVVVFLIVGNIGYFLWSTRDYQD